MIPVRFDSNLFRARFALTAAVVFLAAAAAPGGPWSNGTDPNDAPVDAGIPGLINGQVNPAFVDWAAGITSYQPGGNVDLIWMSPDLALQAATADHTHVVSLGELGPAAIAAGENPGTITLRFNKAIYDGAGADFAVFENALGSANSLFAELGYVEVSTDGVNFARFASQSLTPQPGSADYAYLPIDPTDVYNLAGKHANGNGQSLGTPFDLSELAQHPLVEQNLLSINRIEYVRIVDIPGSGDYLDSQGRAIYDAWETSGSGGLDLEAIGSLHAAQVGDWNRDGDFSSADLDVLGLALRAGSSDLLYDYNNDRSVDREDLAAILDEQFNAVLGDADLSGVVDEADLEILRENYLQPGRWAVGDLNLDGWVDFADYTELARNWGGTSETPGSIPEPAIPAMLLLGGWVLRRRRR